jgi:hypothetical protein
LGTYAFCSPINYLLIDSKHFFLQHLQYIPHIRSLYIPHIADHIHGNNLESRELAMQVVDIVHLKPEIEICYMGLFAKCFEILENRSPSHGDRRDSTGGDGTQTSPPGGYVIVDPNSEDDEESEEEEEDIDEIEDPNNDSDDSDGASDDSDADNDEIEMAKRRPRLRLREILFYDDKVEIFRARHGRL